MNDPKILSCASASPRYRYATSEIVAFIEKWLADDRVLREKTLKIFKSADIRHRGSVMTLDDVFTETSLEEKNDLFAEHAVSLASEAFESALARASLEPQDIDCLVTVSCTGYMIPSLDAFLINKYAMGRNTQRLPVMQMGCAGGTSGLIYAVDYLRANPATKAAVISVELPSLTFQHQDFSLENIVSTAIFADGAACVILGDSERCRPTIIAKQMYHFPESTGLMGYALKNSGFKIVLDREVPDTINEHLEEILFPFLKANGIELDSVESFVFHPGSIKILDRVEMLLQHHGKRLDDSKAILKEHGNMSSATVLFILERVIARGAAPGALALMLSFGPGFAGQSLLLRWTR